MNAILAPRFADNKPRLRNRLLEIFLKMLPDQWKRRVAVHLGTPDTGWSLRHLRRFGFTPHQVLDVGAYRGDWARICLEVFPEAHILCIEPQKAYQDALHHLATRYPNIRHLGILLGSSIRTHAPFAEIGSGSSVLLSDGAAGGYSMTTIDQLVQDRHCQPPDLLKLDVQGYEIEVLEGFKRHFHLCQVIQCELSLLPLIPGAPLVHEVIPYLYQRGFVMFDVDELIRSPSDGAVWQIDAFFCRADSFLRTQRTWKKEACEFY